MRAAARVCATFALLALVAIGFSATIRICGPADARASEVTPRPYGHPLVAAVLDSGEPVTGDTTPRSTAELPMDGGPRIAIDGSPGSSTDAGAGSSRTGLTLSQLSAWDAPGEEPCVYVSFMPIRNEAFRGDVRYRKALVGGEEVDVADVAPDLDEEHVSVELNGEPVAVTSLAWYYAGYGDLAGADVKYMPMCLVRVTRPNLSSGTHDLEVTIVDVETGDAGAGSTTLACNVGVGKL